jgi:hypothetical protein
MSMNRDTVGAQASELSARGAVVRRQVAVLSAGHPDAQIRHTARDLETAPFNSIASLGWLVSDMLRHADSAEQLKTRCPITRLVAGLPRRSRTVFTDSA